MDFSKKIVRPRKDRKICGVCAGIAQYLNVDPTIVRLAWALVTIFGGAGLLAYIVCALIIPEEPEDVVDQAE